MKNDPAEESKNYFIKTYFLFFNEKVLI